MENYSKSSELSDSNEYSNAFLDNLEDINQNDYHNGTYFESDISQSEEVMNKIANISKIQVLVKNNHNENSPPTTKLIKDSSQEESKYTSNPFQNDPKAEIPKHHVAEFLESLPSIMQESYQSHLPFSQDPESEAMKYTASIRQQRAQEEAAYKSPKQQWEEYYDSLLKVVL